MVFCYSWCLRIDFVIQTIYVCFFPPIVMHYNWPYGLYAILTIVCISLVFFGTSVGIIGICGVYVNSLCILCRFMSEERANRVAPDCTLDTNREIEKRWRFQTDFDLIQIKIIKTGLFFKNVTVHLPCTRTHLHRGGSRYSRNARYKRYRSGLHDIKLLTYGNIETLAGFKTASELVKYLIEKTEYLSQRDGRSFTIQEIANIYLNGD